MPPSADSNRPIRRSVAPVKDPFSWPKSSLSSRLSESAAQCTAMKGPRERGLAWWIACAISSLPVPDSPSIRIVALDCATFFTRSMTSLSSGDSPDDRAEAELLVEALVELLDLDLEALRLEGPADQDVEALDVDGLGQEIDRPPPHRLDRGVDVAVGRHHQHRRLARERQGPVDHLEPGLARASAGRSG